MAGSLVAGEADVAHLARFFGLVQRLDHAALGKVPLGVVVVDALVDLPQVEVVGLQALQRLFELPQAHLLVAAVGADLGHQEDLVAPPLESLAHPLLALAVVVLPGVVEEVHAGVDGLVNDGDGFLEGGSVAQAVAAHADDRDASPWSARTACAGSGRGRCCSARVGPAAPRPGVRTRTGPRPRRPGRRSAGSRAGRARDPPDSRGDRS